MLRASSYCASNSLYCARVKGSDFLCRSVASAVTYNVFAHQQAMQRCCRTFSGAQGAKPHGRRHCHCCCHWQYFPVHIRRATAHQDGLAAALASCAARTEGVLSALCVDCRMKSMFYNSFLAGAVQNSIAKLSHEQRMP